MAVLTTLLIRSVMKELSQKKRIEKLVENLESAKKNLEDSDVARREFLSFASHQLKTPMTVIKGYATLANDESYFNSPDKMRQIIGKIGESTDHMYRIILNFLDARTIEDGKMNYILKPTDFVKLTFSIVGEFMPYAIQKGLELTFNSSSPFLMVNADETKFRQVIHNLVDNAIKYTDSGFVKVEVKEENSSILLSVSDSGKGIPLEVKERLFQQFFQERGVAMKTQSAGLGLYIAKEIVKAHEGEIWVESEGEGKGSRFVIKLKKQQTTEA